MLKEVWKDIKGLENKYQISNLGNVKSLKRRRVVEDVILKPSKRKNYLGVDIKNNGKRKFYLIHRLVAEQFIPNKKGKTEVNHISRDTHDNTVTNLEWATPEENRYHQMITDRRKRGAYKSRFDKSKWVAQIRYKGKTHSLGTFRTKKEAHEAFFSRFVEVYGETPWD